MPRCGDSEEDSGAGENVKAGEKAKLFDSCQINQDESNGKDNADQPLGEDVQSHHGGEGQTGDERGFCIPILRKRRGGWGTQVVGVH